MGESAWSTGIVDGDTYLGDHVERQTRNIRWWNWTTLSAPNQKPLASIAGTAS